MKQILVKCNIGSEDRKLRFLGGAAVLVAALKAGNPRMRLGLAALGVASVATAATRYSPLYHALGINRCQPAYRAFPHLLRRL